eukprot:3321897-Rhodomonas_salina.1
MVLMGSSAVRWCTKRPQCRCSFRSGNSSFESQCRLTQTARRIQGGEESRDAGLSIPGQREIKDKTGNDVH